MVADLCLSPGRIDHVELSFDGDSTTGHPWRTAGQGRAPGRYFFYFQCSRPTKVQK